MLGDSVPRKEDRRFITGAGRYVEDVRLPGMLHVAFVRSAHAHANIRGIDVEQALSIPGVVAVITGEEWPELGAKLPELNGSVTLTSPYIDSLSVPPHVLFPKTVTYVGEHIAAVIAETSYLAADGVAAIGVDYEPLPVAADIEAALQPMAPRVHAGYDNTVGHLKHAVGDCTSAFAAADIVFEKRLETQSVKSMAIECRGVAAQWDAVTDTLNVWSTIQFHYMLRDTIANILGLPSENVRVVARDIGGGFGLKGVLHAEDVIVPLIARRLGRPLRWIETRSEHMTACNHSGRQIAEVRVAARRDGKLLAIDLKMYKEVGAYDHFDMMLQINTINHLTTHYRVPNLRIEGWAVATNTPPGSPFRGAGRVEAVFTLDRILDAVAQKTGIDPADIRRRNIVGPEDMPYANGMTYRDGVPITYQGLDFPKLLETALERADYAGWRERQRAGRLEGRHIGIGISSYVEGGGLGPCEGAAISVDARGRVRVKVGVNSQGQGHETTLAQVCAEVLGVDFANVEVLGGDTSLMRVGFGTGASRVAVNAGNAVFKAARTVRSKAAQLAAELLQCDADEIQIKDGVVSVVGARQNAIGLDELAARAVRHPRMVELGGPGLQATEFFYPRTVTWASGVNVAVVEVDEGTGRIEVLKYVFVHDCGLPLNPMIVEGQIYGGFTQGFSLATGERLAFDREGQVQSGSLMDYYVPRASDVPQLELVHLTFATPDNPLGIKSVGESGPNSPPAALAAAVEDALGHRVEFDHIPITTSDILGAMRRA
jgi:carbon-monoxide dehydrogenase large subunit